LNTAGSEERERTGEAEGAAHRPEGKNERLSTDLDPLIETPLRKDAFEKSDEEKIERIAEHFEAIMDTLGLDLDDDSLKGTPHRVAKMYVEEIFSGLKPANKPNIKVFDNKYKYGEMLIEKNITLYSACEHHFLPMIGKAHVGYISNGKVVGLSKINRIVNYYSKRPQVQERLTLQILEEMKNSLQTEDVAVVIESNHLCVCARGVNDYNSTTVTSEYSGKFKEEGARKEFLDHVRNDLS
jgi:GTP cyclohydrolase I